MIEELEKLLKDYDFSTEENIDMADILQRTIVYIKRLEKDTKDLTEIISIQRYNLALMRKKAKK